MPVPLLIISDSPSGPSGLARITRDVATRIAQHLPDLFRVATFGYGSHGSCKLPFHQYVIEGMHEWVLPTLPDVWRDFAGKEHGIIMTVWDASRLLWFARPENVQDKYLRDFLNDADFDRWGYFPMDATGPHDKLTAILGHTMQAYDRVLGYSSWADKILRRTLTTEGIDLDWLPHGIDTSVFKPRNRSAARHGFGERIGARTLKGKFLSVPDDAFMVGIVATNQIRKDYGLGVQAVAEIAKNRKVLMWIHIDTLERHWSIPALINDFGFSHDSAVVTMADMTDEEMSWCYSACDVTLGIGQAEGFGYPIFESLACGTPCVHGDYGGAAEHLPEYMLADPPGYPVETVMHLEGLYNTYRPIHSPQTWAMRALQQKHSNTSLLPAHLDWNNLWPEWEQWLRKGVKP